MTTETDANDGGEGLAPDTVDENSEATTEQPTDAEESGLADDAGEATEEPVKRVPWFQKRIDEVTARKYEAEREAAYWRGLAEGQPNRQPAPQSAQVTTPPDRWEDPEGYDQWLIQTAVSTAKAQTAQDIRIQQVVRAHEEREAQARAARPDFDSVVRDPTLPITPFAAEVIRESASGPEIAYYLGTNRPEAQRIASLPPHRQAVELGRIEATLASGYTPSRKPIPPAPPQTVGGVSSGLAKTMEQMSYSEFVKAREAEEKNRN